MVYTGIRSLSFKT